MYTTHLINYPPPVAYSRNPIQFAWLLTPFTQNDFTHFVMNVKVDIHVNEQTYHKTFTLRPDAKGVFNLQLDSYLDAHLEYAMPDPLSNQPYIAKAQSATYSLSATIDNEYEQIAVMPISMYKVIKGGFSKGNGDMSTFWAENIATHHQPLQYVYEGQECLATDLLVVSALALVPGTTPAPVYYKYRSRDNQLAYSDWVKEEEDTVSAQHGDIIHLPFIPAARFDNDRSIRLIEIVIYTIQDQEEVIFCSTKYIVTQYLSNTHSLIYPNSLGGWNTLGMYSISELNYSYDKTTVQHIDFEEYISKNVLKNTLAIADTVERATPKAETYPMHQRELDRLRDLYFGRTAYIHQYGQLKPIMLTADSYNLRETKGMYILSLAWEDAYENVNYTPDHHIISNQTCPIPTSLVCIQSRGDTIDVIYQLSENHSAARITITDADENQTITYNVTQNHGQISFDTLDLNIHGHTSYGVIVTLQTQCGNTYSAGLSQNVTIYRYAAPTIPTLYAETYQGAGFRTLTFNTNTNSLFAEAIINNDPASFKLVATADPNTQSLSGTSTYQATYNIQAQLQPNLTEVIRINYSPAANFSGRDVINYYVAAKHKVIPGAQSTWVQGKIYINVAGSNNTATAVEESVYVKLTQLIELFMKGDYMYTRMKLQFYKDPYGVNAIDLTGKGITILVRSTDVTHDYHHKNFSYTATGRSMTIEVPIRMISAHVTADFTTALRPSNQYYIIL